MWYYQYDALGRRISKACPQQQLNITYLWDGDQLAYSQTVKQNKLESQRHSAFHGWQLLAQQDRYQQSQQTLDGNKTEWKHETHYAICQPNGQVLALLNQQGKLKWKDEKRSVWGLLFPNDYRKTSPLDPQLLFAGQYTDQESGLAYNRFRHYDPESGNYISSDPIGLNGGERPFGYVGNPLDWVDLFGLAKCPSVIRRKNGEMISAKVTVDPSDIKTGTRVSGSARRKIERLKEDDTGHLLAKVLGGSGKDLDNLFGQLRKVNRGDYRKFEKAIRERLETTGKSVDLEWNFQTFSGSGKRPDRILFKVFQDGKLVDKQWFNNF